MEMGSRRWLLSFLIFASCFLNVMKCEPTNEEFQNDQVIFKTRFRKDECLPCEPGTYSTAENNCTGCEPGFCKNISYCLPCAEGTANDKFNLSTPCPNCQDGSITNAPKQAKCSPCRATTSSDVTHRKCIACSAGTANPNVGGICVDCLPGQYSIRASLNCTPCQAGTYNPRHGSPQCTDCGKGYWNPDIGADSFDKCQSCPSGYYCPSTRTVLPLICPSNHYCDGKTGTPESCPVLYQSPTKSTDCTPAVLFYILIGGVGGIVLLIGVVIWIAIVAKRSAKLKATPPPEPPITKTESESLIPAPLPGPVYTGL
eukprot:TRINITY_DN1620_c0_g1_i1.p1 TRINITY_DN1620_c0_g1~~TRINITY_DN1620_c0_g1_i1.p1  ORF type:complete len:314 (-),score=29.79 TRINITY_DN1620_c0_g1_i1:107-1048(-)